MLLLYILNSFLFFIDPSENNIPESEEIVEYAMEYLDNQGLIKHGTGLDCSGFTQSVYAHFNINLPPSSKDQIKLIECVDIEQMGAGDLVFFKINGKTVSHVGIYLCDNLFIHSPGKNDKVRIDSISQLYWRARFVCGGTLKVINFN